MFAAHVKEEVDDVIDVTRLLPSEDTEASVESASTSASPTPFRSKKCSSAHTHFRLVPSPPTLNYSKERASRRRFSGSHSDDPAPRPLSSSVNHSDEPATDQQLTTSATPPKPTPHLLPPSPPPIPARKSPPHHYPLQERGERRPRPPPSFPLFPVRLVRSVQLPDDLLSTSVEEDNAVSTQNYSFPPPRPPPKRRYNYNQEPFLGEREISMFGKHDVLRYTIPGGEKCYIFLFKRSNHTHDVYRCRECKKIGPFVTVKVIGDYFLTDPEDEPHVCEPVDGLQDRVERLIYNKWREMQRDPRYATTACRDVWKEILEAFDDESLGDEEEREKMRFIYESSGYDNRRITISRNLKRLKKLMAKNTLEKAEDETGESSEDVAVSEPLFNTATGVFLQ
ncbi:hypothetical protein GCK32_007253 [Trichostrongylus colubriformis]|uniref:Uncharacterized protein n=1 Tax=Trichostrongylus colubriformis TaxID=6319 RepID=A0AAN8F228_TRICO